MKLKFILKTISPGDKEFAEKSLQGLICMYVEHTNKDEIHPKYVWPDGTISWFIDEQQKLHYKSAKYSWYSITIKKL